MKAISFTGQRLALLWAKTGEVNDHLQVAGRSSHALPERKPPEANLGKLTPTAWARGFKVCELNW